MITDMHSFLATLRFDGLSTRKQSSNIKIRVFIKFSECQAALHTRKAPIDVFLPTVQDPQFVGQVSYHEE